MTWEREMAEKRDCNLGIRISCSLKEALEEELKKQNSNYVEQIFKAHLEKSKKRKR